MNNIFTKIIWSPVTSLISNANLVCVFVCVCGGIYLSQTADHSLVNIEGLLIIPGVFNLLGGVDQRFGGALHCIPGRLIENRDKELFY